MHVALQLARHGDLEREIGSSSTGPALAIASGTRARPAILKLISDESTAWYLPSRQSPARRRRGNP